jgi:low affinity Fe/Cu permease
MNSMVDASQIPSRSDEILAVILLLIHLRFSSDWLLVSLVSSHSFLFLLTTLLLVLAIGPIKLLAVLTVVSFLTMLLGIGAFLYMRTDIPANVQEKIDAALQQADETPNNEGGMTEQEAINEIKIKYANGDIDDDELDAALERVLTSERLEGVVEEYN